MAGSTGCSTSMQASLLRACSPEGICDTCVTSPSLSPNASRRAAQGAVCGRKLEHRQEREHKEGARAVCGKKREHRQEREHKEGARAVCGRKRAGVRAQGGSASGLFCENKVQKKVYTLLVSVAGLRARGFV